VREGFRCGGQRFHICDCCYQNCRREPSEDSFQHDIEWRGRRENQADFGPRHREWLAAGFNPTRAHGAYLWVGRIQGSQLGPRQGQWCGGALDLLLLWISKGSPEGFARSTRRKSQQIGVFRFSRPCGWKTDGRFPNRRRPGDVLSNWTHGGWRLEFGNQRLGGFRIREKFALMDIWSALSLRSLSENDPERSGGNDKHYGSGCQDLHYQVSGTVRMG